MPETSMRRGKLGGAEIGGSGPTEGERVQYSGELMRTAVASVEAAEAGEAAADKHPMKRRRQQARQLNIGDWSTPDYNGHFVNRNAPGSRRSPSRPRAAAPPGPAPAPAAPATGSLAAPGPAAGESDAGPRRARALQRVTSGGACPGASQQSTASSVEACSKEQEAAASSDSDVDAKASRREATSQRLLALLRPGGRPPKGARRSSSAPPTRRRRPGAAGGGSGGGSSSSHSSSDEDGTCRVPGMRHPGRLMLERARDPNTQVEEVEVDCSVDWNAVGGLRTQIDSLKECVLHPLLYPDMYEALGVVPPRGVLLYGPPGCGKTLAARALAGACRGAGVRVSFFARKGGDIQSKFVGEAEQRLTSLFEVARRSAPSIIFFDEIDGLAPARSESGSEGTSHHNSVVATLLALMDGLQARGRVAILGATNRPELLDAALRRPGRFDRELRFAPPAAEERLQILEVLTRQWPRVSREAGGGASRECLHRLAFERTAGLTGAELRALTAEAAIRSIRRTYPQLYRLTERRFQLSPDQIQVTEDDFDGALAALAAPGARASRSAAACGLASGGGEAPISPLSQELAPLLLESLQRLQRELTQLFPPWGGRCSPSLGAPAAAAGAARGSGRPPLALVGAHALVCSDDAQLLGLLEPALLWGCELPAFVVSLDAVAAASDGAAAHLRRAAAAAAAAAPSILLVPRLERWAPSAGQAALDATGQSLTMLLLRALQQIPFEAPVLVLATRGAAAPASPPAAAAAAPAARPALKRRHGLAFTPFRRSRRLRGLPPASEPAPRGEAAAGAAAARRGRAGQRTAGSSWARLLGLFESVGVTPPGRAEAHAFLAGLLRRGLRTVLNWLLEDQHLSSPLPELPDAPPEAQEGIEERRLAELSREELEREEQDDQFWQRLFRNQLRQVLQSLGRYTRFSIFKQQPSEVLEAAPVDLLTQINGPVTLSQVIARNDKHEYFCVEEVREDFRRIQENLNALFPDKTDSSQSRVRSYACELVDKAEAKLDCIDREVVRALSRARSRRRPREALLRRAVAGGPAEEEAAAGQRRALAADGGLQPPAAPASMPGPDAAQQAGRAGVTMRTEERPGDLPIPLEEAVREGVTRLLTEGGVDKMLQLSEVLKVGQFIQRSLCAALPADAPLSAARAGGRQARALMKQLTDSFAGEYLPPESVDGMTASALMVRRCNAFQRWCRKYGQQNTARQLGCEAVAALLREEKIPRPPASPTLPMRAKPGGRA